jgi:hypothetical protein
MLRFSLSRSRESSTRYRRSSAVVSLHYHPTASPLSQSSSSSSRQCSQTPFTILDRGRLQEATPLAAHKRQATRPWQRLRLCTRSRLRWILNPQPSTLCPHTTGHQTVAALATLHSIKTRMDECAHTLSEADSLTKVLGQVLSPKSEGLGFRVWGLELRGRLPHTGLV